MKTAEERIQEAIRSRSNRLDLSELLLSEVPDAIRKCKWVTELDISRNAISSLPDDWWGLQELQELDARFNRLFKIPSSIDALSSLRRFDCSFNELTTIPAELGNCIQLRDLRIDRNGLTSLPPSLEKLKLLEWLRLDGNPLRTLPEWIGALPSLELLSLANCGLSTIPASTFKGRKLRELICRVNKLTDLPSNLTDCQQLNSIDLSANRFSRLPESLQSLPNLRELFLHGNPDLPIPQGLLGPPKSNTVGSRTIHATPPADILTYYFNVRDGQSRPLNEVKLLLVGRGKAGKSSLRDKLVHGTFDESKPETTGIDIQPWELNCHGEELRIHVWDFAGQEITHATHQFFLTERSVYLLVLEGRTDNQDRDAEYWLRLISTFGKDSPIIVALNQWDARGFDIDRNDLLQRYPSIQAFIPTDCKSGRGINKLKSQLCDTLRDLKEVHEPFPSSWWSVKEYFGTARHNYIKFAEFRTLCNEKGLVDPAKQDSLARILHALGIILHYGEDARLNDTTVLNPQWVTSGVYRLLRLNDGQPTDGSLTIDAATAALPEEPEHMVRYLIELMRRFELCYAMDDSDTRWLVPQVLTKYQPELSLDWQDTTTSFTTRLRYRYKVIPEGLLPRFIVRTHPLSEGRERWRSGVLLAIDKAEAFVKTEPSESRIAITVRGPDADRLRLVQLIRGHLQDIHKAIPGLDPVEQMEIPSHPGVYQYVRLLEQDEQNRTVTTILTAKGSVPIEQTPQLDTISANVMRREPGPEPLRIFVSYSQRDIRHLDIFKQNLKVMQMNGLITLWYDGLIKTGSEWDQDIRHELEEADIIVFMVSTNFLASDYIRGVEMARAIQRKEACEAELVTILLEPNCSWKSPHKLKLRGTEQTITCNLKAYQAIHPANRRAARWPTTPNAFNHVEAALTDLRKSILAKPGK